MKSSTKVNKSETLAAKNNGLKSTQVNSLESQKDSSTKTHHGVLNKNLKSINGTGSSQKTTSKRSSEGNAKVNSATANSNGMHKAVEKTNSSKEMPVRSRPRSSIAASYLSKTADGLARTPKRTFDKNQTLKAESCHNQPKSPVKQPSSPRVRSPISTPKKVCSTDKNSKSTSCKIPRKFGILDKNVGVSSPTVAKIPSDIVRQRVDNIQTSHPSQPEKDSEHEKRIGLIRKSLAAVFEQPKAMTTKRKSYLAVDKDEDDTEDFSVTVAVRVRPLNTRELDLNAKQVVFMNGNETVVTDGVAEYSFLYDHSFWSMDKNQGEFASQRTVYEKLGQPLLCAAFDGYNTCLFAYGQTGSGKSYTIMGLGNDKGVVPRFCDEMFACIQSKEKKQSNVRYHVQVSYFEIYNEKIHDLLVSSGNSTIRGQTTKQVLRVREHPELGPYVEGLSTYIVTSYDDVQSWIEVGNRQRATASTGMNDKSSRSHSVFTLNLVQTTTEDLEGEKHESNCRSVINLVDLAGSERSRTAGTSGQRLKEGASINKSLLTLGKVISTLSERSAVKRRRKRLFVPYRDSALTWILKESLGGNSRTAMIATISPASCHMEETLSTLRYAKQARSIVNIVKINEDPNARIIRELKAEIAKLKESYGQNKIDPSQFKASLLEVSALRKQLADAEKEKAKVQEEWKKKFEQSEKRKAEEISELKRAGVSFKVDNRLPNLVNLNEDPQLSELLLYMIKRGITKIGKKGGDCDIQLNGALIAPLHCTISNIDDVVTIEPIGDATIYVNGDRISKRQVVHHGDRVVIGGDHFFRVNNPIEVEREGRKRNSGGKRKDFEFAKLELIERQNERLQKEVQEAQLQVKKEMLGEIEAAKLEAKLQISSQRTEYEQKIQNLQTQLIKDQEEKNNLQKVFEKGDLLHRHVKIGRKHKPLETQLEVNADDVKFQVFASLEAEKQKLGEEIERMQQRMDGTKKAPDNNNGAISLRLSLLLQESNNISTSLKKQTQFSIHDAVGDQTDVKIKVHNTHLGIWTLWSIEKFEEKLELMRDLYNDTPNDSDDHSNVFYDPTDEWQEAYNQLNPAPPSTSKKTSQRLSRRLSSLVLARASPALQESLSRLNRKSTPGHLSPLLEGSLHLNFCRRLLEDETKNSSDNCNTTVDKLLLSLQSISSTTTKIKENFGEKEDYTDSSDFQEDSFTVSLSGRTLHFIVGFIKTNVTDITNSSPSVAKLLTQIEKATKELIGHISKLLQGCYNGLEQIVNESGSRINRLAPNISKYIGAVSIASNLPVSVFKEDQQQNLSHRLKHAFLQGGDTFMRKVLSGGIDRLAEMEKENIADKSRKVENLSTAAITLLQLCMELQANIHAEVVRSLLNKRISEETQQLYDTSLMINERTIPVQYYSEYLQRTRALIKEVGALIDGVALLNKKASEFFNDSCYSAEVRYKAESLWRPTTRIADMCVKHEGLCAIMHDLSVAPQNANTNSNNNNQDDTSISASDRICQSIYDASKFLQKVLRDFIEMADSGDNSFADSEVDTSLMRLNTGDNLERIPQRKKRILPSSPALLNASSCVGNSTLVHTTVDKWLQFADRSMNNPMNKKLPLSENDSIFV